MFESLLDTLVKITDSEYGFLDDVLRDDDGQLYKKSLALSNIAWDENSQNLYEKLRSRNLEFRNLHNLSGAPALTGELVISNDPSHDPRSGGVPEGHPSIHSYMGIPMFFGGELVGVAGVANREDGYSEEIASFLDTFISTCAGIIYAVQNDRIEKEITKALRYSEEKYRRVVEDQTEFLVRWRPDGIRTFVNDSYCRYFGKSPEELIGSSFFPLIPEEDWEKVRKRIESFTPDNPVSTDEHRVIRPDGSISWNRWTDRAIFDENGQVIEFQSTGRDITERKRAENALRQHDEFLRSVLESLTHPFLVINANDYTVDMANSAAWKGELAAGSKCYEVSHMENRPCCDVEHSCSLEHIKKTGLPMTVEHVHYDQLGNARNVEVHGYPLCDDQGKVTKIIEYCLDVTERKKAEEALKDSKEFAENLIETANAIIVVLDSVGTITTFNKFAEELTGYRKNEVLGQNWFDLFIPENEKDTIDGVHKKVLEDSAETSSYESFILTRNGEKKLIDWSNHSITGSKQEVLGTIAIGVDITECKKAEEALRESEKKYRLFYEDAPLGYQSLDASGNFLDVNKEWLNMLGYSKKEVIGRFFADFVSPEFMETFIGNFPRFKEDGKIRGTEFEMVRKDGSRIIVSFNGNIEYDEEGHFRRTHCIMHNITSRRKAEEKLFENQAQLRSLVSQLTMTEESERKELAGILHDDLIQRLVMCKMRLDELGKSKTLASRSNSLDEIGESIREMIKGTRSLTFDLCSPVLYDIGLEAAIRDWLDREVYGKYDITFEFTDDGQQRQLSEDLRIMLYRAVRELCTNVIKHSKAKKAKVSIRSKNNDAEIIVEDNGIGIKMGKRTSDYSERGGLGLFGIRERLNHFGASMNIDSEADAGTKIKITVPMNR